MSDEGSPVHPDVILRDLTPTQVVTQMHLRHQAAEIDRVKVSFTEFPQPDGKITLIVRFASLRVTDQNSTFVASKGGLALTAAHWQQTLGALDNPEPALFWALIKQESETIAGFLPDRRPIILYERHVFSRNCNPKNVFDKSHPDISGPEYQKGEYGSLENQYSRLLDAMALDHTAALMAASWGIGQTLGEGAVEIGYASVDQMVRLMEQSEDLQLDAIIKEIREKRAVDAFKNKANDLKDFARLYNGTGRVEGYASELREKYQLFLAKGVPDLSVRAVQLYLSYAGEKPGPVDGVMGDNTRDALRAFQSKQDLPATGTANPETLAKLEALLAA
jgi:hypothetical protein